MKDDIEMVEPLPDYIQLVEQATSTIALEPGDVRYITALGFQVGFSGLQAREEAVTQVSCEVNPGALVGHFQLPSHRIVIIKPKVDTASIFRMLAYVFTDNHRRLFRDEQVKYATERLLFEPLVELFNELVNARARRGLQDSPIQIHVSLFSVPAERKIFSR